MLALIVLSKFINLRVKILSSWDSTTYIPDQISLLFSQFKQLLWCFKQGLFLLTNFLLNLSESNLTLFKVSLRYNICRLKIILRDALSLQLLTCLHILLLSSLKPLLLIVKFLIQRSYIYTLIGKITSKCT